MYYANIFSAGEHMGFKLFQAKILLFGEYSVIHNSRALSIPYSPYSGQLAFPSPGSPHRYEDISNQQLRAFFGHLSENCQDLLQLETLDRSLERGLYFNSTIPHGFGLGSSGALCAAIYSNYKISQEQQSFVELKELFARMESYFHGQSSGMDPLICYLGRPLLSRSKNDISTVEMDLPQKGRSALFLINSNKARQTGPLVNLFLEKCKSTEFETFFKEKITPLTNRCIDLFLQGKYRKLWDEFVQLSTYQLEYLKPMIPAVCDSLWRKGLQEKSFALKLCGAGGGGFYLGMTKDFQSMKEVLKGHDVRPILFF